MSLEIKQELKRFEDKVLPDFLKRLEKASGHKIKVELEAATFTTKVDAQMVGGNFCNRFLDAAGRVCKNDLGKEAFGKFIHTIKISSVAPEKVKEQKFEVKDGVLYVAGAWGQSGGAFPADDFRKYIEKNAA